MLAVDDAYAAYPGMMGEDEKTKAASQAPGVSGNVGCANGACGTGLAPPSRGTFQLPGFGGALAPPSDGTGFGPS